MKTNLKNWALKRLQNNGRAILHLLFNRPERGIGFVFLTIFLLLLPGQNFYQTQTLIPKRPLVRENSDGDFAASYYPVKISPETEPAISAASAEVLDVSSGVVLFAKNTAAKLRPASTTKLMTALVALDYYQPDQVLTVGELTNDSEESEMGLAPGDQLTIKNLIYGLLVPSGNDAAETLAANYPGGREAFIFAMNKKAAALHLYNTHYQNPTGTDAPQQYTSSQDLAWLAARVMKDPLLTNVVATNWIRVPDISGKKSYPLQNVNQLLSSFWGAVGVKTGYTEEAGQCLVAAIERNGRTLITVVLKSSDRFTETALLANWAFRVYKFTPDSKLAL